MLGIIKNGRFKEANNKKILIFKDEEGKNISVVNPKEIHFLRAGYKEVIYKNEKPQPNENQYIDVEYIEKQDNIEANYILKNFD